MTTTHRCGRVALMGPPNAGKSTLINALVGRKVAIVTSRPQTTRNRIVGILTERDAQIIFMDTPGVHALRGQTRGHLGRIMAQSAWQSLDAAHCVLLVLDGDLYVRKPEYMEKDLAPLIGALNKEERPVIVAVNKVDLFHDKSRMLPLRSCFRVRKYSPFPPCSATGSRPCATSSGRRFPKEKPCSPKISSPQRLCGSWRPKSSGKNFSTDCTRKCRIPWPWT